MKYGDGLVNGAGRAMDLDAKAGIGLNRATRCRGASFAAVSGSKRQGACLQPGFDEGFLASLSHQSSFLAMAQARLASRLIYFAGRHRGTSRLP